MWQALIIGISSMSARLNTNVGRPACIRTDSRHRKSACVDRSGGVSAITGLIVLIVLLASPAGHAEVNAYRLYLAERGEIPWQSLSPAEQDALKRHRGNWDSYSSDRQQHMRQGAKRYLDLPPDKRREVEKQRNRYEQLSPQERKRLREEYKRRQR